MMPNFTLSLSPLDTFFFRDGKPFSKGEEGEESEACGIFPPFPSTAYGALRTEYIAENGFRAFKEGKLKHVIGTLEPESIKNANFRIKGIFLADESHTYFTLPRDIVQEKEGDKFYHLSLCSSSEIFSNAPFGELLIYNKKNERAEYPVNAFINQYDMKNYLLDCEVPSSCMTRDKFLTIEPKIGIGRNAATLTSKEGLLYRLGMMRFNDNFRLNLEVCGISLNNRGILKLGGENKPFAYEITEPEFLLESDEFKQELAERLEQKRKNGRIRFKIYLATPSIWDSGWNMDAASLSLSRIPCEIITAAVGKYSNIGGWDLAKTKPKTMYRAVPAGSVYYCETEYETTAKEIIDAFHYKNISDRRSEEGFGLAFVGAI